MDELPTTEFRQMLRNGDTPAITDEEHALSVKLARHSGQPVLSFHGEHVFYKDGDKDLPEQICDANGSVALSETTGTGLRYNQGKPPMELVPIRALAEFLSWKMKDTTDSKASVPGCLFKLAKFQERVLWRDQADSAGFLHAALSELGFSAFAEAARVFDYGRNKYHEWNWAGGFLWSVPLACAVRHLMAMADGQENDEESGLPHRGHVACNIIMLLTFLHKFPELDNRPPLGTLRKELPL